MGKPKGAIWCNKAWSPVHYAFVPDAGAWAYELKRLDVGADDLEYPQSAARTSTLTNKYRGKTICLVTMDAVQAKEYSDLEIFSLLAHEASHVWQSTCDAIGEKKPGRECEAYSIQHYTQELMRAYLSCRPYPKRFKPDRG